MKNPLVGFIVDTIYNGLEFFGKYYSEYRAYVINNNDPQKEGRLQLMVPGIIEEPTEYWAPSSGVFAGQGYGLHLIPPNGSVVWVSFENGNPNFPIWRHGYFAKGEIPEDKSDVNNFWLATPFGHSMELDDTNQAIRISNANGDVVELNENGISLQSDNIYLGTIDDAAEPAVMGDTLEKSLNDLNDTLSDFITEVRTMGQNINSTIGNLATPADVANPYTTTLASNMITQAQILNANISNSLVKLETFNKSISAIKEGLPKIKSQKIRLDYE